MFVKWFLNENDYEDYRKNQKKPENTGDCEGEYIGSARIGNLCFDILNYGNHLWFDLYVGGVDSGYGYSIKDEYKNYPYDFADSISFKYEDDVSNIPLDDFKNKISSFIEEHLNKLKTYECKGQTIDLLSKANECLVLW